VSVIFFPIKSLSDFIFPKTITTDVLLLKTPRKNGSVSLSALGLRRDPHGSMKQIHHEELEDGDKERPSPFPKVMLKQTDSDIQ
jgi:hypothetical protein